MSEGPEELRPRILYEDNHLVALNKRAGEISQSDKSGDPSLGDLLASFIKSRDGKPGNVYLTPVHRLDRPVSGVLVFAKTGKAASRMSALFRDAAVEKRYWAIVGEAPPEPSGTLAHYLTRNRSLNKSFATDEDRPGSRRGELEYRIAGRSERRR